jgi:hypothetical protein
MQTRRCVIASMAGAVVLLDHGSVAWGAEADDVPSAKLVAGKPPVLDYGGGVLVPCTKDAFYTLWEGDKFWLTFGFGISPASESATRQATKQAAGLMKFLLLTLAFAPARLVKVDGNGWRKKDPAARDFVLGELKLPLRPSKPMTDAFLGGGNTEIGPLWNWFPSDGAPDVHKRANRNAFCSQIVMKKDLSLEDVRKRAVLLQI